jgi:hypothetical protein
MEDKHLQKVTIINPYFQLAPIMLKKCLESDSILCAEIYTKGKDYLHDCIKDIIKSTITTYFYKDIVCNFNPPKLLNKNLPKTPNFQLPLHIQSYTNPKVL